MIKIRYIILSLLNIFPVITFAQEKEINQTTDIEGIIESIAENTEDEDIDFTELAENLKNYLNNPINLNSDDLYKLKELYLLNDIQINNLINYTNKYGKLLSVFELLSVEGFDKSILNQLIPFVSVEEKHEKLNLSPGKTFRYSKNDIIIRYSQILEKPEAYQKDDSVWTGAPNKFYLGNRQKYYFRYSFNYKNHIRAGFLAEKDPGELFIPGSIPDTIKTLLENKHNYGFDFYSGYLLLHDIKFIRYFSIGNYQLNFGQGLTLWTGFSFGKTPDAINIKKFKNGIKPNTSSNENNYFKGVAATFSLNNFEITAFYSRNKIDANIIEWDSSANGVISVSSIQNTGYHRTVNELLDKNVLRRTVIGGNLSTNFNCIHLGLTAHNTRFDAEVLPDMQTYNKFYFRGNSITNLGMDFNILFKSINIFGEVAASDNSGWAILAGSLINLKSFIQLALLYRNYRKNYQNLYSNAFSENSKNINENGLYTGIQSQISRKIKLSAYMDIFSFPWLKYNTDAPSTGKEYLIQADYMPSENLKIYARYKWKEKSINCNNGFEYIQYPEKYIKQNFRINMDYIINERISMRDRIEFSKYKEKNRKAKHGYLIFHDIRYTNVNNTFNLYFRYALFDTDGYDARIYTYENDVLYAFSIPALFDRGSRIYLLTKVSIIKNLDFWLKLSQTLLANQDHIGTGKNEIEGNKKTEIKVQVRFVF